MARLEDEARCRPQRPSHLKVRDLTAQILGNASSFPLEPARAHDATLLRGTSATARGASRRGRCNRPTAWTDLERRRRAMARRVLWSVTSTNVWSLTGTSTPTNAIRGGHVGDRLVEGAIRDGRRPHS